MAYKKRPQDFKKGHHPKNEFKKGHGGLKAGGIISELKKQGFTREAINEKIAEILTLDRDTTAELRMDSATTNFELMVISLVEASIRTADAGRMDNLLEKIFGKSVRSSANETSIEVNLGQKADEDLLARAIERAIKNKE